jgi:carbon-monoxide dehydrogenase small subunit
MSEAVEISLRVNGEAVTRRVPARQNLVDFLRETLGLQGTRAGCEHGACGACTVRIDGAIARACLTLAAQLDGAKVETIEGLSQSGEIAPLQAAFHERNAVQCGFCTAGILMSATDFLSRHPRPSEAEVRDMLSGHICRCTGYYPIVKAILDAARAIREAGG